MRYHNLQDVLAAELTREDTGETRDLVRALRGARRRGHLTKGEFLAICRWKSPRAIALCRTNSSERIRRRTAAAFASRSERVRFEELTALHGVGAPTASAILTMTDPRRYGVLDIRVWQLMFELGSVRTKPGGAGFRLEDWLHYLATLRRHARALGAPVRAVEYSLFLYHRRVQRGPLYGRRRRAGPTP